MAGHQELKKLFEAKDASIIVAHPTNSIRGQITSTLKAIGFKSVNGASEIADIVRILGEEPRPQARPVWILTTLYPEDKANALQLGRLLRETPEIDQTFWSLITGQEDSYVLPLAIEQGLLSWHPADQFAAGDGIKNEITSLIDTTTRLDYNPDLVALHYARLHLRITQAYDRLLKLTGAMVELKPDNGEFLFSYADALALNKQPDAAKRYATKALWMDKSLMQRIAEMKDKDQGNLFNRDEIATLEQSGTSVLGAFGISRCVIVDPDNAARNHLRTALEQLGIKDVTEFEDGESAWEHIRDHHGNSILITEWKLPKLSGMALLQRMHQKGIHDMPVIISSAQLGPQDRGLLEELGSGVLLQKPLSLEALDTHIRVAVKEENLPSSFKGIIRKVRTLLRQNNVPAAKKLWSASTKDMLVPGSHRKITDAEILLAEARLEEAYLEAQAAAKLGANGAYFFNLLGKITFALGDFDSSADWFDKANKEVAINIQRLADLATVELHRGDTERASEIASDAEKIDAKNPRVVEAKAMVAIEKGDVDEAAAMMAQLNDLMDIVAHLNNRAVALAWKGDHDRGIGLYREALSAAPKGQTSNQKSFAPFVTYNMALALARKGDLSAAEKTIATLDPLSISSVDGRLSIKVGGFQKRVRDAIQKGGKMEIDTPRTSDISKKRILKIMKSAEVGDAKATSLLKELKVLGNIDYRALKMVEKPLRFNTRKA